MRLFLLSVFFLTQLSCFGQIFDDFSDGDFTSGTPWSGTVADYIVNSSEELQLNNVGAATSYLSTPHNLTPFAVGNKEWQFWTRQSFSPSSGNFGRIYLTAANGNLPSTPDGFYLQLGEGGSTDAVRLFKSEGGVDTELTAGPSGQISASFIIGVRVVRTIGGDWSLYIDPAGGTNFGLVGSANDVTDLLGTHSGILNIYTASNSTDFYYDNVYIGEEILDITPPVLLSATAIGANQIDVLFDEALDQAIAEDPGNYSLGLGNPTINTAMLDGTNPALVHLTTTPNLQNGQNYTLTTTGIADLATNISGAQTADFAYLVSEIPVAGDVVINEIMFDQTPQIGQPNVEYVEIHNRSTKIFNVQDWELGDASGNGTVLSDWLLPNGYMILTKTSGVDSFAVATGVTSFQSLLNSGDNVVLRSNTGVQLDSISYLDDWWNNPAISGGVSIERINPNDPCSDGNDWTASEDPSGGTPGAENSVFDPTPDTTDPELSFLLALNPNFLEIYYNEGMDATALSNATFVFSPALTVLNNYVLSANMQTLEVTPDFVGSQTYTIEIQGVSDCWGNTTTLFGEFALPEIAESGDLIINELLVDPVSGGKDWIEIYNNSDKLIDLFNFQIADYEDDTIADFKIIDQHILIGADEYIVLGEDISQIVQHYITVVPDNLYETDLPSYNNDSGTVYLIYNNTVMDRVAYKDDWHFQLLDNTDGVSLERIDPNGESSNGNNWHSAAEAIGFATPGLLNSQFYPALSNGEFNYTNEVVSPDSDGYQDVLQINYQMVEPGYVGHFTVYDDRGRLIKRVVESELLGASGTFSWGGVNEDGNKASIGTYVGVFEAFQIDGGVAFTKRKAFVVAGKI